MKLLCPAKINLYLHILGKRADGFHELETVMCPVGLYDELELERADSGIELKVEGAELAGDASNLAYRAAAAVMEKAGQRGGLRMRLKKRIPMGEAWRGGAAMRPA
ncbi:MAG: hypothetical protein HC904_11760 [Blastochloris sp.]|nr:hypothetical protein [Blastochloris sp.]